METGSAHPATGSKRQGRGGFGTGRIVFWNGGALWIGRATGAADVHAHHAIQLALALEAPFRIRAPRGEWRHCNGAVVPSHAAHQFDGEGQPVAILFIEPETAPGRALLARHPAGGIATIEVGSAARLAAPLREAFDANAGATALGDIARRAVDDLVVPLPRDASVDPRITAAIGWIRGRLSSPLTLAGAAASVHLSPGRFRHLFVAQTGTTFRAYLLWARVGAAVAAGMAGRSWTDAAQDAGFADSAHLARTCRRMIGLAPGMLARQTRGEARN